MIDSDVERSTFSHVSILLIELEATNVRLLVITLIPFMSELFVRIADVLEPFISCLLSRGSFDVNTSLALLVTQTRAFEFPVVQVQVTLSLGHVDCLSQTTVTEVAPKSKQKHS